jgi:adenosine deaminase CECR1
MGAFCSSGDKEGDEPPDKAQEHLHLQPPGRLHRMSQKALPIRPNIRQAKMNAQMFSTEAEYFQARAALIKAEKATAFDAEVIANASVVEIRAMKIVQSLKNHDWDNVYNMPPSARRAGGMDANNNLIVKRTAGEHFLTNVDLINQTKLFQVARKMPKGAHLHVHFNSCLSPKFLIQQARNLPTMWINSSHPLPTDAQNYEDCRIQFSVLTDAAAVAANESLDNKDKIASSESNIFSPNYSPLRWMKYKDFQGKFDWTDVTGHRYCGISGVEAWLAKKMQFDEEEVHGVRQTSRG